ncbi:MAG: glycerophosphodiester phosphodiesterase family protein [Spirochaetes bacterium]|nr:glycerophosphodiester phosphodiesterase family protein [Spirochaetota bacterium]
MEIAKNNQTYQVQIIAHRGANDKTPEHTIASLDLCIQHKLDYLEVDVRSSADGVLYNFHDPDLKRIAGQNIIFQHLHSSQIDKLDAGTWFHQDFAGANIPRISEILKRAQNKINIYFDVKNGELSKLIKLVYQFQMEKNCFFWFKSSAMVTEFKKLAPELKLKINCSCSQDLKKAIKNDQPQIIECHYSALSREFTQFCHDHNIAVMLNAGTEGDKIFRQALDYDIDMIVLDYPLTFLEKIKYQGT